jgi:hypothetical protein
MNPKQIILSMLLCLVSMSSLHAQTEARVSPVELDTERSRIAAERAALERRALQERTACYQKFAVEDCLSESRARQRVTLDQLRRDEARINDITRRERGGKALERLDQKNAPERARDDAAKREQAQQSQQGREERAADHAAGRASAAAQAGEKQRAFDNKQRAHAERQAGQDEREARTSAERERHEDKLRRAAEHNAERERKNAERKKPRAAALPPAS